MLGSRRVSSAWLCGALLITCACGGDKSAPRIDTSNAGAGGEGGSAPREPCAEPPKDVADTSLAEAYQDDFRFGVALNGFAFFDPESERAQLAGAQFNRATAENAMKWSSLERVEGEYDFQGADLFVELAESFEMEIHGHTLVWHQQVPDWVFQDDEGGDIDRAGLLARLENHMALLADRYGERVAYWDVVNEAFDDDGSLRESPWRRILGEDYLMEVFAMADRYFPEAKLVYNDFSMFQPGKRDAVLRMLDDFDEADVRIDAIGMQAHYHLYGPPIETLEEALAAYGDAGIEVLVTELDVNVLPNPNRSGDEPFDPDPYTECVPESIDELIADRWGELLALYKRHSDFISSVTVWGLEDGQSWLNGDRTNHALLFDRQLRPKSNYVRVIEVGED